ncbi:MAG: thioesterase family protein [Sphingomonadales bacterium]
MAQNPPLEIFETTIRPEWIDYNGHMNVAYYLLVFDKAVDKLLESIGMGKDYTDAGRGAAFSLECHITYQREVLEGDPVRVTVQMLDLDSKSMHFFLRMHHAEKGFLVATCEQMGIHVDIKVRKSAPFPTSTHQKLRQMLEGHQGLPRPVESSRPMGIRRGKLAAQ